MDYNRSTQGPPALLARPFRPHRIPTFSQPRALPWAEGGRPFGPLEAGRRNPERLGDVALGRPHLRRHAGIVHWIAAAAGLPAFVIALLGEAGDGRAGGRG